jgi:hypothetical protein
MPGGHGLEGPPRRPRDRDGASALVGGRQIIGEDRGWNAREVVLVSGPPPANRRRSNERDPRAYHDIREPHSARATPGSFYQRATMPFAIRRAD